MLFLLSIALKVVGGEIKSNTVAFYKIRVQVSHLGICGPNLGPIESLNSVFLVCKKNDLKYTQRFMCK